MVPNIYLISIICQFHKKVVLGLSEHDVVIETQSSILYFCDTHNNEHIAQSFFRQSFLASSIPGIDYELLCLLSKYDKQHVFTFDNSLANSTK